MLRTVKQFADLTLRASDGEIGKVSDLYFDDKEWVVRYIVANTGDWLSGRRVLIAPAALRRAGRSAQVLPVDLTREQVRNAPGLDAGQLVSREHEIELSGYYGWPAYWPPAPATWALPTPDAGLMAAHVPGGASPDRDTPGADGDPHLRSGREVMGYHLRARDGRAGKVDDFVVNDETWRIDFLVIETGGPLSSKKVVLAASWVQRVADDDSSVQVDLDRKSVEGSPEFDPATILPEE